MNDGPTPAERIFLSANRIGKTRMNADWLDQLCRTPGTFRQGVDMGTPGERDRSVVTRVVVPGHQVGQSIAKLAEDQFHTVMDQREEILRAFMAKHGCGPGECEQVEMRQHDFSTVWFVRKRASQSGSARLSLLACLATALLASLFGVTLGLPLWQTGVLALALGVLAGLWMDGRSA